MKPFARQLRRFLRDESGRDMAEYALFAGFISVILILTVKGCGDVFDNILYQVTDGQ